MDPKLILIFGDRNNAHALQVHNSLRLCDGTFKIFPMPFHQLFKVHIQFIGGFTRLAFMRYLRGAYEGVHTWEGGRMMEGEKRRELD